MSRPTVITGPLAALIDRAGGVDALAASLRVSAMTLWRWGTNKSKPRDRERRAVNAWAKRRGLPEPFSSSSNG